MGISGRQQEESESWEGAEKRHSTRLGVKKLAISSTTSHVYLKRPLASLSLMFLSLQNKKNQPYNAVFFFSPSRTFTEIISLWDLKCLFPVLWFWLIFFRDFVQKDTVVLESLSIQLPVCSIEVSWVWVGLARKAKSVFMFGLWIHLG